jgi:DnaJ-class molecular chaperone
MPCLPPQTPHHQQPRTDYDSEMVGRSLEHSFKAFGLGLGAVETEIKIQYHALAYTYHPGKHNPIQKGMMHEAAADYFKLINNTQSHLCKVL